MKNIALFILFLVVVEANAQVNFNTLPAISSITATSPFPTVTSGGKWRKATAAQMQAFIMPRPVTRVAPSNRYVLGYVNGFDSLQYIPGGIMSQLPLGNVTIATDTAQFNIQALEGLNFTTAAWGSGWVNRVSLSRSGASTLSLLKAGQTMSIAVDTSGGARLRWGNIGIQAKQDSMFLTTENLDSIGVNEVLTVVSKFSDRAYVEFRSGSGSGDVTRDELADSTAAIRATSNGIYSGSDSLSQENTYAAMAADGSQTFGIGRFPDFPDIENNNLDYGLHISPIYWGTVSLHNYRNKFELSYYGNYIQARANDGKAESYLHGRDRYWNALVTNKFSSTNYELRWDTLGMSILGGSNKYRMIPNPSTSAPSTTSGAISSLTWTAGTPSFLRSQHGVATGTTDGSGDLTVTFAAAMPDATYTALCQSEGSSNSYTWEVHTKTTANFKIRVRDSNTKAVITATSVTFGYEAKDY